MSKFQSFLGQKFTPIFPSIMAVTRRRCVRIWVVGVIQDEVWLRNLL